MKCLISLIGFIALAMSAQACAGLINFENASSLGLNDNDAVTNQYEPSDGVTFTGAYLEKTGEADANPQGYLNDQTGHWDDPFPASPSLGNWFLRTQGEIMRRGGAGLYMTINYDNAVSAASGQIWDIDGNRSQGSEQWEVKAFNGSTLVATDTSWLGTNLAHNGDPWTFNLNGGAFDKIEFFFTGSKSRGIGLAFDNFRTSSLAVPEPSVLGMFGLGLVALLGLASRRNIRGKSAQ